ncbi:MAG: 2OG-Fe(II) oxygenase [Rhodoferax sp.]|nr:2OG-Fe(II) oxygenase [Rhodoferax sp.]
MSHFEQKARDYNTSGIAVFTEHEGFLDAPQWERLEQAIRSMTYEPVILGDAGEINNLDVARFMTDVQDMKVVDEVSTAILMDIVATKALQVFYRKITGFDQIFIRRAQVNRMRRGSFIGEHVDRDSNPNYAAAVVLQFGRNFSGGDFVVRGEDGAEHPISPTYRSVVITRCDVPHRVATVTHGERTSLVYFLADHSGPNDRYSTK